MDRRDDTGRALTEIRTVLSRAKTARSTILNYPESTPGDWVPDGEPLEFPSGRTHQPLRFEESGPAEFDPERDEMIQALDAFIALADRWKGRKAR
jgi:hypothetical protein